MEKYERVFNAYSEFLASVRELNENEFKKLILGLEYTIWLDKVSKLQESEAKTNE